MDWMAYASNEVKNAERAVASLTEILPSLQALADRIATVVANRHTILLCGNGGSATQALHIAAELTGRFRHERPPYGVQALVENIAAVTAIANDYTYDRIFSRQVEAFGKAGDLLVGLTTSGNSPNVIEAIRTAHGLGLYTVALTGASGGQAREMADLTIRVPTQDTAHIQEAHLVIGHFMAAVAEEVLIGQAGRVFRP
jgi:D-sedoheptulose 7-phosphate isomerase